MNDTVRELTVRLPESLIEALGGERKAAEEFTQAAVLDLVRTGRISAGKGAELLHLTRYEFLDLMNAHDVPVIDYCSVKEGLRGRHSEGATRPKNLGLEILRLRGIYPEPGDSSLRSE